MTAPNEDAVRFREAMSRVPAAVHVVTTDGPEGRHGATATAVTSVTDAPPTILVCLNLKSTILKRVTANGVMAVNALRADQEPIARAFARASGGVADARFDLGRWESLATGSPTLAGALAVFDGRVAEMRAIGSHAVLFVRLEAVRAGEADDGLVYHRRRYFTPAATG